MGFTQIPNDIIRHPNLTASEKIVYCVIKSYNPSFPGLRRIAKECCVHRDTVIEAIKKLEALNLIRVERKQGLSNRYEIVENSVELVGNKGLVKGEVVGNKGPGWSEIRDGYWSEIRDPNNTNIKILREKEDRLIFKQQKEKAIECIRYALDHLPKAEAQNYLADYWSILENIGPWSELKKMDRVRLLRELNFRIV